MTSYLIQGQKFLFECFIIFHDQYQLTYEKFDLFPYLQAANSEQEVFVFIPYCFISLLFRLFCISECFLCQSKLPINSNESWSEDSGLLLLTDVDDLCMFNIDYHT